MKNKTVWKLYSGADWTLHEAATTAVFALSCVGIGVFLSWLVNVG